MAAGVLKQRITWGPLGPPVSLPAPPALTVAPSPPPPPVEARKACYGVASGILTLAGRGYAWEFRVRNPYLPLEQGIDQDLLRKWRVAVLRDLIRRNVSDPDAARTARGWANLSWIKVARFVHQAEFQQGTPKTPRSYRTAIAMSFLALQVPGGSPAAFAGGPHRTRLRNTVRRTRRIERYVPMLPSSVVDPETGAMAATPRRLSLSTYQALFPDDPAPPIVEKRRRPDLVVVALDYAGMWRESARRAACGRQGGNGKKKPRPAPSTPDAERGVEVVSAGLRVGPSDEDLRGETGANEGKPLSLAPGMRG